MRQRYVPGAMFVNTTSPSAEVDPCRLDGPSALTLASASTAPVRLVTVRSIDPTLVEAVELWVVGGFWSAGLEGVACWSVPTPAASTKDTTVRVMISTLIYPVAARSRRRPRS